MEREISIILKVKGAKAAKKAVNEVFDGQTATLVKGFNKETKKTGDNMKRVTKTSKQAGKGMQSFTKVLGRGMAALYLYNRAWSLFGENFESGLALERASDQFNKNVGNVVDMLPVLRSATKGVIADFDLLKTANRAFQQGIKPESMGKTFKLATVAAQRLGLSATDAISTITNAITKQDEGALNTLGIVTKVNQAYKTQAALIAKNGGVMSNAMSIQLRQSLVLKELESRFGGANKVQADGLQVLERFKASWRNFKAEIGQTLGIALIPLTRALTSVLDVTTRLLDKLNDTGGFQKFVKIAGTLGIIFGSMKFISGARALMGLFSVMKGTKGLKMARGLAKTNVLMGAFGKVVSSKIPILGRFSAGLARILGLGASFARLIPGWGTALTILTLAFDPIVTLFSKAWTAGKVFFQLLSNFDENTGLSRVLKSDAKELGSFYNFVENSAKIALEFWAVLKGIGQGVGEAFEPVGRVIGWASGQLSTFTSWLFSVDKSATVATSRLDAITNSVRRLVKWIGLGASSLAFFIPGLQTVGLAGAAGFGASLAKDYGVTDSIDSGISSIGNMFGSSTPTVNQQPQMSTTSETPSVRAMNIESSEDTTDILKKILKENQKANTMTETKTEQDKITQSQVGARQGNVWRR